MTIVASLPDGAVYLERRGLRPELGFKKPTGLVRAAASEPTVLAVNCIRERTNANVMEVDGGNLQPPSR